MVVTLEPAMAKTRRTGRLRVSTPPFLVFLIEVSKRITYRYLEGLGSKIGAVHLREPQFSSAETFPGVHAKLSSARQPATLTAVGNRIGDARYGVVLMERGSLMG